MASSRKLWGPKSDQNPINLFSPLSCLYLPFSPGTFSHVEMLKMAFSLRSLHFSVFFRVSEEREHHERGKGDESNSINHHFAF